MIVGVGTADLFVIIGMNAVALFVEPASRGEVDFTSDDRLQAGLFGLLVEFDRPEEVPMVGDGDCGHPEILGGRNQRIDLVGPIQKAVFGMEMKVDKILYGHDAILMSRP